MRDRKIRKKIKTLNLKINVFEDKEKNTPKFDLSGADTQPENGLAKMVDDVKNKENLDFQKLILSLNDDEKIVLKSFYESDSKMNKTSLKR